MPNLLKPVVLALIVTFSGLLTSLFTNLAWAAETKIDIEDYAKFKLEQRTNVPAEKDFGNGGSWISDKTRPNRTLNVFVRRVSLKVGDWIEFGRAETKHQCGRMLAQAQSGLLKDGGPGTSLNRLRATAQGVELVYIYSRGGVILENDYYPNRLVIVDIR